jgi:hypothetical protein
MSIHYSLLVISSPLVHPQGAFIENLRYFKIQRDTVSYRVKFCLRIEF